ncbi:MAG: 50S ribosomal protein L11 methyltransferase [Ruminococcaceae bacterium]|nr:50S ribosomal protein L11 methyltransferase [Oscillospiraceae bacterium]
MEWIQVSIDTSHNGIDILVSALEDIGIRGFEIEDPLDFSEFMQSEFPYRDYVDEDLIREKEGAPVKVKIYVSANEAGHESLLAVRELLGRLSESEEDMGSLELSFVTMNEEDWSENWKQFFHPLKIGSRVLVRPEWEECENEDGRVVFTINPGMSFGTGSHATTQLCLEAIEEYTKDGDTILDLGCGSGILSITACLLGAERAVAVDIDKNAVDIAVRNAELNGVGTDKYEALAGNILENEAMRHRFAEEKYDIVAANIVADVIIGISPFAGDFVKKDGIFIASGIITERLSEVLSYLEKSFKIIKICDKNGWASVIATPLGK